MKKTMIAAVLLLLMVPTLVFAGNPGARDIYREVVGEDLPAGKRAMEAAEEAGKGEEFFNAMQAARKTQLQEKVKEGVLTQEEADFLSDKKQCNYQDMKKMQEIRAKLWQHEGKGNAKKIDFLKRAGERLRMKQKSNADCPYYNSEPAKAE